MVNDAYQTLKDPRERLKYLLGLETGEEAKETSMATLEVIDFYMEAGDVCQEAESFLKRGGGDQEASSRLIGKLRKLQEEIKPLRDHAMKRLEDLDREWMKKPAGEERQQLLKNTELLSNDFSYLSKLGRVLGQQILDLS
jgi:hypothetical protein